MAEARDVVLSEVLEKQTAEAHATFLARIAQGLLAAAAGVLFLTAATTVDVVVMAACGFVLVVGVVTLVLLRGDRFKAAVTVFLYGVAVAVAAVSIGRTDDISLRGTPIVYAFLVVIGGLFLRGAQRIGFGAAITLLAGATFAKAWQLGWDVAGSVSISGLAVVSFILLLTYTLHRFSAQAEENLALLRKRVSEIDRVMAHARRIADRDLVEEVEGEGEAVAVVRAMSSSLRELVGRIRESSARVAAATAELSAMARQQEQGAVEQSTAVEQIRRTLESLAGGSKTVADSAHGVAANAATTADHNEQIGRRIAELTEHTQRIGELLEVIKDIANKAELLALNAALEGAKAGEVGQGFSLVAAQMQRLAEYVMDSVKDVKALTSDVRQATQATVSSVESATRLAAETSESAHRISIITQQQRSSTEQVAGAMEDIAAVAKQVVTGSSQTLEALSDLMALSEQLNGLVGSFRA
jgi:methyl-accepting chemotaxis protein